GLVGERGLDGLGGALEALTNAGGEAEVACDGFDRGDGVAEGDAGREVEGEGDDGELALVVDGERGGGRGEVGEGGEGHGRAGGRAHVDVLEGLRVLLEARLHLEDDVVLVQPREDRGHVELAEGGGEGVVDRLGGDAEGGGGAQGRSPRAVQPTAVVDDWLSAAQCVD